LFLFELNEAVGLRLWPPGQQQKAMAEAVSFASSCRLARLKPMLFEGKERKQREQEMQRAGRLPHEFRMQEPE